MLYLSSTFFPFSKTKKGGEREKDNLVTPRYPTDALQNVKDKIEESNVINRKVKLQIAIVSRTVLEVAMTGCACRPFVRRTLLYRHGYSPLIRSLNQKTHIHISKRKIRYTIRGSNKPPSIGLKLLS